MSKHHPVKIEQLDFHVPDGWYYVHNCRVFDQDTLRWIVAMSTVLREKDAATYGNYMIRRYQNGYVVTVNMYDNAPDIEVELTNDAIHEIKMRLPGPLKQESGHFRLHGSWLSAMFDLPLVGDGILARLIPGDTLCNMTITGTDLVRGSYNSYSVTFDMIEGKVRGR